MANTVISAFNEFQKDIVNLDSSDTSKARSSRDWLVEQIHKFSDNDSSFPLFYTEKDIFFGSFARRTKKRPLDDIDLMICLHAQGGNYNESYSTISINVKSDAVGLKDLCFDNTLILNSKKVINKFVSKLNSVPQYDKANIKRNQEAATLKLLSYNWNFDIVPCFFTTEDAFGNTYYLIPDGAGNWKKTDPRKDRDRVRTTNTRNNGNVLNVIRIMKYWNKRPTMPSMGSYLIENMILDYYDQFSGSVASEFVDFEVVNLLKYIKDNVFMTVPDPKGIQGDLNNLSSEDKIKIYSRANSDYDKAIAARNYENDKLYKESINKWREIFGLEFPVYG